MLIVALWAAARPGVSTLDSSVSRAPRTAGRGPPLALQPLQAALAVPCLPSTYLMGVGRALGVACADSDPPTSCDSNTAVATHDNGGVESPLLRLLMPIPPDGEMA